MSERSELIMTLEAATALVAAVVAGRISPKDFIQEYGSFYYYNALDGHEATPEQLSALSSNNDACRLHEQVQSIVDLVYLSDVPLEEYEAAGRLLPQAVVRRICDVATRADVVHILEGLRRRGTQASEDG